MATALRVLAPPARPVLPTQDDIDGDDDRSLAEVMHEIGLALEADGLIVAWHDRPGGRPVVLFADGADADHDAASRLMVETVASSAGASDAATCSEWRVADADELGGELITTIPASGGVVTITSRFNRLGAATRVRARNTVMRLLPMVRPFIRLWAARRAAMSRVRGLTAAVNKSDIGMLLVNRHGQLLFANAAAETLLAENDGIRRQGKMLSGGRLADTLRLQATIEHVITSRAEHGREQRAPVVALAREGRRPLLAAVLAGETAGSHEEESAAIIYLCDPDQDFTGLVEPTCKLYGLSPVETRLACLLAQGLSLTDAAETMRVREQTARSYLKQIFLKTDTNRQAELVWLMLKSSVRATSATFAGLI